MKPLLIAALMLVPAHAAHLRITVYDQARLPREVSQRAFNSLRQIFHEAGIEIELVSGDPASQEASLLTSTALPRKGSEQSAACRARRDIALEIVAVTPASRRSSMLGMAEPFAREGLNARVFADRAADAAFRQNRDLASVLAHAMAHEIGHVLLRTSAHGPRGLMSVVWGDYEYDWMAHNLMLFNRAQSRTMQANLTGEGCTEVIAAR